MKINRKLSAAVSLLALSLAVILFRFQYQAAFVFMLVAQITLMAAMMIDLTEKPGPAWISLDLRRPAECESVLIIHNGEVYPAFWQDEAEGDWEVGYKHFRVWYYPPDWERFEPMTEPPEFWMPFPDMVKPTRRQP